jgi:RND family efflux transporter MFP subunit
MIISIARRRTALVAGAGLILGMVWPACSPTAKPASTPAPEPIPVTVATAAIGDVTGTFEAGGVVQARTTATVMARIAAPVLEVRAAPGDRVRSGQLLILLDGRDLAAQARRAQAAGDSAERNLTAASAEREAADAALALARTTQARIAGLHAKRSATTQELDDATGIVRAAEGRAAGAAARAEAAASDVQAARAASEAAATTATFARLVAPFDGLVTEKMVEPGNMAGPGTPLMRVEDTGGFRLDVRVDESRIQQIRPGSAVAVSLDPDADGVPRTVSGTVAEIGRSVDADARAFLVKVTLPAVSGLRSGMFGRARFSAEPRRALTVPAAALIQRGQITSVFVVENGVAHLRLLNVSGTEVLAGLSAGEMVVVAAPPGLTDGRAVSTGGR